MTVPNRNELTLDLSGEPFRDKVYGCWLGKNAGGTLGAPLEKGFGQPDPFDVWWYPRLQEGGIPNDDLEMQLIWLRALEEVGPGLDSRDLARYWLDHVGYNFDEYGMAKTNLRLGLEPPVSGYYNNWFKDCMGCPIRSEIWACIAPGAPRLAVRYAYQDAICDHGGGESVYGELFNTAVESAAFVLDDRHQLVEIGLSYLPEQSKTAQAIRAVLAAYAEGLGWKVARKRVLEATPHHIAQYSPINLGFQVIGLLYGEDFGDGICKTVNCGYDTDSSGATTGSYLGLLAGASGLPRKWIDPLGDAISTNESWGGVRHLFEGDNPAPATIEELTDRIRWVSSAVLRAAGILGQSDVVRVTLEQLYADHSISDLWSASPTQVHFPGPDVQVSLDYLDSPAVVAGTTKRMATLLENRRLDPLEIRCRIAVPDGWNVPAPQQVLVPAGGQVSLDWDIPVPGRAAVDNSNRLFVAASPVERPEQPAVPLVLIGATACRISGPYPCGDRSEEELLNTDFPPEHHIGDNLMSVGGRGGNWQMIFALENSLPLQEWFDVSGVLYLQTFLHLDTDIPVRVGAETNCPARVWLDGDDHAQVNRYHPIRPSYGGNSESAYADVKLRSGWHELVVKLVRGEQAPPVQCHLLMSRADKLRDGLPQIGRTRFPWDLDGEG